MKNVQKIPTQYYTEPGTNTHTKGMNSQTCCSTWIIYYSMMYEIEEKTYNNQPLTAIQTHRDVQDPENVPILWP